MVSSSLKIQDLVANKQAMLIRHYLVNGISKTADLIGDFNGDGFDDFILSAPFQTSSSPYHSISYILFGSATILPDSTNLTKNGIALTSSSYEYLTSDYLEFYDDADPSETSVFKNGHITSPAGDFNNDGYDDILISIPYYNNNKGLIYLIFGGSYSFSTLNLDTITSDRGFKIYGDTHMTDSTYSQSIGDFNKDGFDDIAIHETNPSTITVIYGKSSVSNIYLNSISSGDGFKINVSPNGDNYFGYWRTVDTVGDINGDGYPELAVAQSTYLSDDDEPVSNVFIVYGSNRTVDINLDAFDSTIGFYISGFKNENMVSGLGDINGDGKNDILIGSHNESPDYDSYRDYAGKAFVITGGSEISNGIDIKDIGNKGFTIIGAGNSDEMGEVLTSSLDVNNDGFNDILIGSSNEDDGAYIIFGGDDVSDLDLKVPSNRFIKISENAEARSVTSIGDFNGDGYDDFVIGYLSESYSNGNYQLYFSDYLVYDLYNTSSLSRAPSLSPTKVPTILPTKSPTNVPTKIPSIFPSISPSFSPTDSSTNAPTVKPSVNPTIKPTLPSIFFSDLSVSNKDLGSITSVITGSYSEGNLGLSVCNIGDFNGDGYDDIAVSSIYENYNSKLSAGRVYFIFGSEDEIGYKSVGTLSSSDGFFISGGSNFEYFGTTISSAGDFNNDGYDDLIIGSPSANNHAGRVYVIFGTQNSLSNFEANILRASEGFVINGAADSRLGSSVSYAGDVNGDGFSDIIIAASNSEKAYVIFGKNTGIETIQINTLTSNIGYIISGDNIGYAVSGGADINDDGYDEVIIGASKNSPKSYQEGITYVLYGKSSGFTNISLKNMTSSQGFYISGENYNDQSGYALSCIGDFNKDGYDDILIGAPFALSNKGKTYIIYGAQSIGNIDLSTCLSTQCMKIIGSMSNGLSGYSLNIAGDVNKDGFHDIIIGAYAASPKTWTEGVSYVIYGNSNYNIQINLGSLTGGQGFILTGKDYSDRSGTSVSTAGDFNKDGCDDIIVSAPFADGTSSNNLGKVYVIYGSGSYDYTQRNINSGGSYVGTSSSENFIIDSSDDVTITGGAGSDLFTFKPHANTETIITDFDKDNEKIDLSSFENINIMDDLTITAGSVVITLDDEQVIKLLNLQPSDITQDNFVFFSNDKKEDDSSGYEDLLMDYGIYAGIGVAALALSGCLLWFGCSSRCSSNKAAPVEPM